MTTEWDVMNESIILTKKNKTKLYLCKGQFITYEGHPMGVRIENFAGDKYGPMGFTYLPWRGNRWATPAISIGHGDPRFIICLPEGFNHWGIHINWDSVEFMNGGICPVESDLQTIDLTVAVETVILVNDCMQCAID